ncbi:MAG: hypothetical protein WC505_07375 [Patescibacteria group bacterium]
MTDALHHVHLRKRIHQQHEAFPHPVPWKRLLDRSIYAVGIIGPALGLPQVFKIFIEQQADGVSIITWAGFVVISAIWLFYGFVHKEKPIIVANGGYMTVQLFVVFGSLLYG